MKRRSELDLRPVSMLYRKESVLIKIPSGIRLMSNLLEIIKPRFEPKINDSAKRRDRSFFSAAFRIPTRRFERGFISAAGFGVVTAEPIPRGPTDSMTGGEMHPRILALWKGKRRKVKR